MISESLSAMQGMVPELSRISTLTCDQVVGLNLNSHLLRTHAWINRIHITTPRSRVQQWSSVGKLAIVFQTSRLGLGGTANSPGELVVVLTNNHNFSRSHSQAASPCIRLSRLFHTTSTFLSKLPLLLSLPHVRRSSHSGRLGSVSARANFKAAMIT